MFYLNFKIKHISSFKYILNGEQDHVKENVVFFIWRSYFFPFTGDLMRIKSVTECFH